MDALPWLTAVTHLTSFRCGLQQPRLRQREEEQFLQPCAASAPPLPLRAHRLQQLTTAGLLMPSQLICTSVHCLITMSRLARCLHFVPQPEEGSSGVEANADQIAAAEAEALADAAQQVEQAKQFILRQAAQVQAAKVSIDDLPLAALAPKWPSAQGTHSLQQHMAQRLEICKS